MTPTLAIEITGGRQSIKLSAIVDTGFDGDLCVPTRLAVQLGLELMGEQEVELADGTHRNQLVFAGTAEMLGETREVKIMLTESEEALVGTELLEHFHVSIEFPGGRVRQQTLRKRSGGRKTK